MKRLILSLFIIPYKIIDINTLDSGLIKVIITRGNMNQQNKIDVSPNIYLKIKEMYKIPTKYR